MQIQESQLGSDKNTFQTSTTLRRHLPSPKSLSNEALLNKTMALVGEERKLTTEILWHLAEIQIRRLYAEKGYGSLFEYAVQELGYSEGAAGRRISAMRLLVDVPEIEPALKDGSVSLSTLSTIQSFVQRKVDLVSTSEKRELVFALQGKSRRECEKHLVALDPVAATPKERERVISSSQTEIRFVADDSLMEKLETIRELDGHVQSNPSYLELFHRMADLALKKLDPAKLQRASHIESKAKSEHNTALTPPAEPIQPTEFQPQLPKTQSSKTLNPPFLRPKANPRFIPAALKREIWRRDQSRCAFKTSDGKQCGSKFALELDHKLPVAWGGKSEIQNLQLLCREHNRLKAVLQLGSSTMSQYLR